MRCHIAKLVFYKSDFLVSVVAGWKEGEWQRSQTYMAGVGRRKQEAQFLENGERKMTSYLITLFPRCPTMFLTVGEASHDV